MQSIHNFHTLTFIQALKAFFKELHVPINYLDDAPTDAEAILKEKYNSNNKAHKRIEDVYVLGVVDDAIFEDKNSFQNRAAIQNIQKDYDGLLIFGITLTAGNLPTRSLLAEITRAFSQVFPHLLICIVFRYENFISLASSERISYKQAWREGEKIGKVTLLKDIYIHKPHAAHDRILQELQLKPNVNTFAALHAQWGKVLTTKELNNQFFKKIANWYFWAVANVKFPESSSLLKSEPLANQKAMIRFITRIIFVWFLKEKKLVPEKFFDTAFLAQTLKDFDPEKGATYYLAILQNLFFATLNRPVAQRDFAPNKGFLQNKNQYDVNSLFRYEKLFQNENLDDIMAHFADIPFLNGGLFDCLDKKEGNIVIDGFSRNPKWQAHFPNFLLFGAATSDFSPQLNDIYQTKKAKYEVKGLFRIFEEYKFTIEENTPDEQDIALDPVLLGEIFENLLAYYNPETATTARKGTGSFYTPQEIVNYMVDESLQAYLAVEGSAGFENPPNLGNLSEKEAIINRLANIKILDPACGSGAFPMVILHKMVQLLKTLDPDNKIWQKIQKQKLLAELDSTYDIQDKALRDAEIQKLNDVFEKNLEDYGRKLYLIRNCIYGVDIQDVAIQISKLRFFLSLVIDQNNDNIQPLPNLETKFVVANTLIAVDLPFDELMAEYDETWSFEDPTLDIKAQLKKVREQHFTAANRQQKKKLKTEDERLRKELTQVIEETLVQKREDKLAELRAFLAPLEKELTEIKKLPPEIVETSQQDLLGKTHTVKIDKTKEKIKKIESRISPIQYKIRRLESHSLENRIIATAQKLAKWDIYDQNAQADWFDSDWMFGIKEGFDVVIGNPPYVQLQKMKEESLVLQKLGYETFESTGDLYCLFYEKGIKLLKDKGIETFITSSQWLKAGYGKSLRRFFLQNNPLLLLELGPGIFESATVDSNILLIQKTNYQKALKGAVLKDNLQASIQNITDLPHINENSWAITSPIKQSLQQKIIAKSKALKDWDIEIYRGVLTGYNEAFIIDEAKRNELVAQDAKNAEIIKPVLRGREIHSYLTKWEGGYIVFLPWHFPLHEDESVKGASLVAEKAFNTLYPTLYKHFISHKGGLSERNKAETGIRYEWYALQRCAATYKEEFTKEKIIWKRIGSQLRFSYSDKEIFCLDSTCIATGEKMKYLTALLNSKLCKYQLFENAPKTGMGDLIISVQALEPLFVYYPTEAEEQPFIELVDKILSAKQNQANTQALEAEIDRLVYRLYNLTEAEIAIIEKAEK